MQEALTNIAKHAQAHKVRVTVERSLDRTGDEPDPDTLAARAAGQRAAQQVESV